MSRIGCRSSQSDLKYGRQNGWNGHACFRHGLRRHIYQLAEVRGNGTSGSNTFICPGLVITCRCPPSTKFIIAITGIARRQFDVKLNFQKYLSARRIFLSVRSTMKIYSKHFSSSETSLLSQMLCMSHKSSQGLTKPKQR